MYMYVFLGVSGGEIVSHIHSAQKMRHYYLCYTHSEKSGHCMLKKLMEKPIKLTFHESAIKVNGRPNIDKKIKSRNDYP